MAGFCSCKNQHTVRPVHNYARLACGTSLCRTPAGRLATVQIGCPADLSSRRTDPDKRTLKRVQLRIPG